MSLGYCGSCGEPVEGRFCRMCGAPFAAVPAEAMVATAAQQLPHQQTPPAHRPAHAQPLDSQFESLFRPPEGEISPHGRTQLIPPVEADYRMPPPAAQAVGPFGAGATQLVPPQAGNGYPPGAGRGDDERWDGDDEPRGARKPVVWATFGAVAVACAVILGLLYIGSKGSGGPAADGTATSTPTAVASTQQTFDSVDLAPGSASPSPSASPSASVTPGGTTLPLSVGSTGPYVHYVQTRLRQLGYYHGDITGQYDQATAEAVSAFQARAGVTADPAGTVGRPTLTAMIAAGSQPNLRYGQRSGDVRRLQEALNAAEDAGLTAGGKYDAATYAAVRRYQQRVGINPTGLANQQTWAALQSGRIV